MTTRWEYHSLSIKVGGLFLVNPNRAVQVGTEELNRAGEKGWELVSVVPLAGTSSSSTTHLVYYFRRPLDGGR